MKTQKPSVGLPIARAAAIVSRDTACVIDLTIAPYQGKETGESALLRSMLDPLTRGDIAVMNRYYCSFQIVALLLGQGTQTCARKHQLTHSDFRRGWRPGKYDHLIVCTRPERPTWMNIETYRQTPEPLLSRDNRLNIVDPGRRSKSIDVITTFMDADECNKEDVAAIYGFRWNSELDIRSIKSNLNLGHIRCNSPEMVHREVWTTMLAYNLVRTTADGAALVLDKPPRQISFTSTCQYGFASWMQWSIGRVSPPSLEAHILTMLEQIAPCEIAYRPGRIEPRVLKGRRHGYQLMMKPRNHLVVNYVNTAADTTCNTTVPFVSGTVIGICVVFLAVLVFGALSRDQVVARFFESNVRRSRGRRGKSIDPLCRTARPRRNQSNWGDAGWGRGTKEPFPLLFHPPPP